MYRYVMGSGGGLGNLLKASEEFQQTDDWVRYPTNSQTPTVNADSRPDPNGGTTADQVGLTANTSARLQQTVTLSASTQYTFSVYARAVSGTVDFRMRNVTLRDAEVKTATTTGTDGGGFTRFTYTFTTTTAGSYELALQNDTNATAKDVIFWGAMLNQGGTAADYEYAAPTTGGSAPTPAYAGFGDAFGGVTAYYSLRQFTEAETLNAIRVRRSSDDTEQDIGFDANGDLDTTALLAFVNEDYNTYTSDFSSGTDGWFANGGTADGNIDGISDGTTSKDDVLRLTLSGGAISHSVRLNGAIDVGNVHDVSFEYYIPSGQTMDGILFRTDNGVDGNYQQSVVGTWTSVTIEDWSITQGDQFRIYATDGGSSTVDGDDDVFYLKNIVVTQTTADGAVTTWYDQAGSNDATNSTDSEQPLIVSGGTLKTENGKAALDFDGVDDYFTLGGTNDAGMLGDISVFSVNKNSISGNSVVVSTGTMVSSYAPNMQWGITGAVGGYTGTTSDGTTRINESISTSDYGSQMLVSMINDEDGNLQVFADGVGSTGQTAVAPMNDANFALEVGRDSGGQRYYFDGTQQELILFASDQSANLGTVTTGGGTLIQGNINTYFDIV